MMRHGGSEGVPAPGADRHEARQNGLAALVREGMQEDPFARRRCTFHRSSL